MRVLKKSFVGVACEWKELKVVVGVVGEVEKEGEVVLVVLFVNEGIGCGKPFLLTALCLQLPGSAVFSELAFKLLLAEFTTKSFSDSCCEALLIGLHYYITTKSSIFSQAR